MHSARVAGVTPGVSSVWSSPIPRAASRLGRSPGSTAAPRVATSPPLNMLRASRPTLSHGHESLTPLAGKVACKCVRFMTTNQLVVNSPASPLPPPTAPFRAPRKRVSDRQGTTWSPYKCRGTRPVEAGLTGRMAGRTGPGRARAACTALAAAALVFGLRMVWEHLASAADPANVALAPEPAVLPRPTQPSSHTWWVSGDVPPPLITADAAGCRTVWGTATLTRRRRSDPGPTTRRGWPPSGARTRGRRGPAPAAAARARGNWRARWAR
jgi:hypothetical protein